MPVPGDRYDEWKQEAEQVEVQSAAEQMSYCGGGNHKLRNSTKNKKEVNGTSNLLKHKIEKKTFDS